MARKLKRVSARTRKREEAQLAALLLIGLAGVVISSAWGIILVLLIAVAAALAVLVYFDFRRRQKLLAAIDERVRAHCAQLRIRQSQLLTEDGYGGYRTERWNREVKHFATTVLAPELTNLHRPSRDKPLHILALERIAMVLPPGKPIDLTHTSPQRFEVECADIIRANGWRAALTKGSGDQGIDIIAERTGTKVVLQCKLYSRPVGNAAVQEIAAGRSHERAQFAAVVSNQEYTTAARELAATNGVELLHPEELPGFLAKLAA